VTFKSFKKNSGWSNSHEQPTDMKNTKVFQNDLILISDPPKYEKYKKNSRMI